MNTDWRLIADDPPPLDVGVLVSDGTDVIAAERYEYGCYRVSGWKPYGVYGYDYECGINDDDIKWWMPLPAPPGKDTE